MKKSKYEKYYLPADEELLLNEEDEVLFTIRIKLPKPPPLETIDGYGLPPEKQKFNRVRIPKRLEALERKGFTIDEIWEYLTVNREKYEDEISFIYREWDRRLNGYWVFINGKPTYIDGWHYFYLNYWKIDIGYPEYRSRDRKFFLAHRYAYTTHEAYFQYRIIEWRKIPYHGNKRELARVVRYFSNEKDAKNYLYDLEQSQTKLFEKKNKNAREYELQGDGYYVDMGRRTVFGINYPKHRREGATYKAECINYQIITLKSNSHGGIQSMDGSSAKKAFQKALIKPWRKVPFFFKPRYDGSTNPKVELTFDIPGVKIGGKGSITNIEIGLESMIDYAETASRQFYDGDKLHFLHNDEVGKTMLENVNERWSVQKKCLSQGDGVVIHGLASNTSTVGEMSEKGGAAFFRLCQLSHFEKRNNVGQTSSGLINLFIPSYDGLEGFIDIFGNSIIDDPEEKDLWRIKNPVRDSDGKLMGAKRFLQNVRDDLLVREDEESLKEYEEEVRLHPNNFSECFITKGSGSGLDLKIITKRIKQIQFDNSLTRRGNFKWENGIRDSRVIWEDDPVNGKWVISLLLNESETNQLITIKVDDGNGGFKDAYTPLHPGRFTAGADPYKFRKTQGKRMSNGGGNVFWERDKELDPDDKPVEEWESHRIVCTYSARPYDPDDYAEDMLMMCVYYGAMMFPEINISLIWDYFVRRGYDGFLKYQRLTNGTKKNTPGYSMNTKSAQRMMQLHQQYIKRHGMRERHIEYLQECKQIKGVEDITNWDLFASVGASLMGSETDYSIYDGINNKENESDLNDISQWI